MLIFHVCLKHKRGRKTINQLRVWRLKPNNVCPSTTTSFPNAFFPSKYWEVCHVKSVIALVFSNFNIFLQYLHTTYFTYPTLINIFSRKHSQIAEFFFLLLDWITGGGASFVSKKCTSASSFSFEAET